ncbi:TPA: nuclear transport factor 2 family protein [Candidatus Woesearchaeota archaeon]|nr:nuclear transport factor 2 family protein [Candidatus Woesearchaeota archaeon]HII64817.1 nuclear transport factor 2 family protein [Candidatus Woesearchaeota archaeon]HII66354.1 nuclear transport factor 2 family protein [Candidatus Woesearchaeota archaeon]HIJ18286.1 nuclear transport factor 2 family protein [Candidatus Woesearchaeota archaeon]
MATQWTHDLFRAIDRMDSRAFAGFLAEDAVFRFGNMPEVKGRGAITTAVEQFFSSIRGLRHRILHAWEQGSHVIVQGEVTYTRKDGKVLTLPFANIFVMEGGKAREYLIYADVAPLFAP